MGIAMGYGDGPHCLECMAEALGREREEFRDRLLEYILERDCYREGWLSAGERERSEDKVSPGCLWASEIIRPENAVPGRDPILSEGAGGRPVSEWDAGDTGCGELVMELRARLNAMKPGDLLKLTARDPGAPEDLPAWCRLTGHKLVELEHPTYWIRRRED